jgi:hypothetical protein
VRFTNTSVKVTVLCGVTPRTLIGRDVSEERIASIFTLLGRHLVCSAGSSPHRRLSKPDFRLYVHLKDLFVNKRFNTPIFESQMISILLTSGSYNCSSGLLHITVTITLQIVIDLPATSFLRDKDAIVKTLNETLAQ